MTPGYLREIVDTARFYRSHSNGHRSVFNGHEFDGLGERLMPLDELLSPFINRHRAAPEAGLPLQSIVSVSSSVWAPALSQFSDTFKTTVNYCAFGACSRFTNASYFSRATRCVWIIAAICGMNGRPNVFLNSSRYGVIFA